MESFKSTLENFPFSFLSPHHLSLSFHYLIKIDSSGSASTCASHLQLCYLSLFILI